MSARKEKAPCRGSGEGARVNADANSAETIPQGHVTAQARKQTLPSEHVIRTCPRFDYCNAPQCALDPKWRQRVRQDGDPVCFYLRESVKTGARARFMGGADEAIYLAACQMLSESDILGADTRKRLREAASTGSVIDRAQQLSRRRS